MKKQICILHGNCQGEALAAFLASSFEFSSTYEVQFFVNFSRQAIPAESLSRCALFLYQHLGAQWGELASETLISRLPSGAKTLCYPNMLFKGYWPFWVHRDGNEFADFFLESLIERGLTKEQCRFLAVHGDVADMFDLDALLRETFEQQRAKEALCDVAYVDSIAERFRTQRLFRSINHPGRTLLLETADALLDRLGMPGLSQEFKQLCPELFLDFELPINPQVAKFHGLGFVSNDLAYNVYGRPMTYARYVERYLECRLAGRVDLVAFLTEG